jgi:hypothetical protein
MSQKQNRQKKRLTPSQQLQQKQAQINSLSASYGSLNQQLQTTSQ